MVIFAKSSTAGTFKGDFLSSSNNSTGISDNEFSACLNKSERSPSPANFPESTPSPRSAFSNSFTKLSISPFISTGLSTNSVTGIFFFISGNTNSDFFRISFQIIFPLSFPSPIGKAVRLSRNLLDNLTISGFKFNSAGSSWTESTADWIAFFAFSITSPPSAGISRFGTILDIISGKSVPALPIWSDNKFLTDSICPSCALSWVFKPFNDSLLTEGRFFSTKSGIS